MKEIRLNIEVKKKKQWYIIDLDHLIRHGYIHQTTNVKDKATQSDQKKDHEWLYLTGPLVGIRALQWWG